MMYDYFGIYTAVNVAMKYYSIYYMPYPFVNGQSTFFIHRLICRFVKLQLYLTVMKLQIYILLMLKQTKWHEKLHKFHTV